MGILDAGVEGVRRRFDRFERKTAREKLQEAARNADAGQFYGTTGTIHRSKILDVETFNGEVVAVWFRCLRLPFRQTQVSPSRASEMRGGIGQEPEITGITYQDA